MSKHYLLNISVALKSEVSAAEKAALDFLINGVGNMQTGAALVHPYFQAGQSLSPLASGYRSGFPLGEYMSVYWRRGEVPLENSGVSLLLPGIKDIQGWYDTLKFVDWLCSLTKSEGLIGYITDEENQSSFSLLYSFDGRLYFRDEKEIGNVVAFSTGQPRSPQTLDL